MKSALPRLKDWLSHRGFRPLDFPALAGGLRFNNYDVMTNRAGVLETIVAAIDASPSLALPRKRERESGRAMGEGA
jgi:hypothetical protein